MKKLMIAAIPALAALPLAAHAAAPTPKISKAKAEQIALKVAPGKIVDAEYEKEGGAYRWSFDIQQNGHIQEVGIDGQTGKVVENSNEGKVDHD